MNRPSSFPMTSLMALGLSACAGLTEVEPYRETSCVEAARVTLTEAIQTAEIEGGTAIDAAYRQSQEMGCLRGNPGYYDVTVVIAGQLSLVSVNADTQQVGQRLKQNLFDSLGAQALELAAEGSPASRIPLADNSTITLLQAIGIAERRGGKAMEARIDVKNGQVGYIVKLVDHGRLHLAWVGGRGAA